MLSSPNNEAQPILYLNPANLNHHNFDSSFASHSYPHVRYVFLPSVFPSDPTLFEIPYHFCSTHVLP